MNRRLLLICCLLAGCTGLTPRVQTFMIGDVEITEHIDTNDHPTDCGDRSGWDGCYAQIAGKHHIWRTSMTSVWVVSHGRGHALGMRHTEWVEVFGGAKCAKVYAAGGRYKFGQTICIDRGGERVFGGATADSGALRTEGTPK